MIMSKNNSTWIAGIARGHNSGICLLKDGEVVDKHVGVTTKQALQDKINAALA